MISKYLYATLGILLLMAYVWCRVSIVELKTDLKDTRRMLKNSQVKTSILTANNSSLKAIISSQNSKIEKYEIDINKSMRELEVWKNKPEKVRYKKVYIKVHSDGCEDIKGVLDEVKNINFTDL